MLHTNHIMKNSGVQWIGLMPSHWIITKGKYLLKLLQKPILNDDGVITCFRDGEVTLRSNRREDGFTISEKEIGYQGIDVGDLVVHGMDGFAGAIGISDSRGKASPVLNVLDSTQNKRYLMYYLRAMAYGDVFVGLATGIRVRSCDLSWSKLSEIVFPVPPLAEQEKIARYLDEKCAEIDAMAASIRKEVETLVQYKCSVVIQTVTKGLNMNARLKNSSIEWIGDIPEHWGLIKNRYIFNKRKEIVGSKWEETQLLSLTKKGVVRKDIGEGGGKQPTSFSTYQLLEKGDIIMCLFDLDVSAVFSGLSTLNGMISPAYKRYKCNDGYFNGYYKYYFDAVFMGRHYKLYSKNLRYTVDDEIFDSIFSIVPPIEEQMLIAEFLDKKCSEIDGLIMKKEEQLGILDSYKKSLIYEYVTGKKAII